MQHIITCIRLHMHSTFSQPTFSKCVKKPIMNFLTASNLSNASEQTTKKPYSVAYIFIHAVNGII